MPNQYSGLYHPPMYDCSCDTWALTSNQLEPMEGSIGTGWTIVWLYVDSDFQPSRSESFTPDTFTYGTLKLAN
jgi:hypothetical protein